MAYATVDELAVALGGKVTAENTALLEACLQAAAEEIDTCLGRVDPLPDPPPAVVARTNVNRAVEWYKAPDTYNGGVGFDTTGSLPAPSSGFERHAAVITKGLKQQWGVG